MRAAGPQARFMHCLPAERGIECTEGVVEAGERRHQGAGCWVNVVQQSMVMGSGSAAPPLALAGPAQPFVG